MAKKRPVLNASKKPPLRVPAKKASKVGARAGTKANQKKASTKARSKPRSSAHPHAAAIASLRAFGLAYPETHTKSPWPGHLDVAVRDKTFAYLSMEGEPLSISCKLPHSSDTALALPFSKPTAYGLGKSGWVTATFATSQKPPLELLEAWIDESYRAQAPKSLVKKLPAR